MSVDISGLDPATVVQALYNGARPQGMGFLHYTPEPMGRDDAEQLVGQHLDYVRGRVMKLTVSGDSFEEWGYDRDNGQGAADTVILSLRMSGDPNNEAIQALHKGGVANAAKIAREMLTTPTTKEGGVINLGLADMASLLGPKINKATE